MKPQKLHLEKFIDGKEPHITEEVQKAMAYGTENDQLRKPGKEVLVAVISDLNRKSTLDTCHAVPAAYYMSGFSLRMLSDSIDQIVGITVITAQN